MKNNFMNRLKELAREVLYFFSFYFYYWPRKKNLNQGPDNQVLKKGITAVISAKDEAYLIPFCLKSLIGVADQIVCIDNGSKDGTLRAMEKFKEEFGGQAEVDVISMPGALLGDCRNAGVRAARYQWHLRWDADMISKTSGEDNMIHFREKVLKVNKPTSFQLPRTNLIGDLSHTHKKNPVIDQGEPFLIWLTRDVFYKEYGKFDAIKIPFYHQRKKEKRSYIFHCQGIKSVDNLIHRFHYFTWRELVNSGKPNRYSAWLNDFEAFKKERNLYLFGTNDEITLAWRYYRQLATHYIKYNPQKYGDYPPVLKEAIEKDYLRFKVIYRDGKPFSIEDKENHKLNGYMPTAEDLSWDVTQFFRKLSEELN